MIMIHSVWWAYTPISKNVVGKNDECQLSNGDCTTEKNCGYWILKGSNLPWCRLHIVPTLWFVHVLRNSVAEALFFVGVCERSVERYISKFLVNGHVKPGPRSRSYGSISLAPREELIVFAYQIWKPKFLSVVQFPFDNCHSPLPPTTFLEIGVYPLNPIIITFLLQANRHADSDLPCGQSIFPARKIKVLRIKPATMWVALSTEGMPADFKRYVNLLTLESKCYFFTKEQKKCMMFGLASYLKETPVKFLAREKKNLFSKSATWNACVSDSNLVPRASVSALQWNKETWALGRRLLLQKQKAWRDLVV